MGPTGPFCQDPLPLASDTNTFPTPALGVICITLPFMVSAFMFPITSSFSVGVLVPTPILLWAEVKFTPSPKRVMATILKIEFCFIDTIFVNF
jgi:hypothetical protein